MTLSRWRAITTSLLRASIKSTSSPAARPPFVDGRGRPHIMTWSQMDRPTRMQHGTMLSLLKRQPTLKTMSHFGAVSGWNEQTSMTAPVLASPTSLC
eukprot:jgi/Astpho2/9437/Aster-01696